MSTAFERCYTFQQHIQNLLEELKQISINTFQKVFIPPVISTKHSSTEAFSYLHLSTFKMSILNHSPTSTTRSSTSPQYSTTSLSQPLFSNLSSSNAHLEAATNVSVASAATVTEGPFRSLIAQKERELHDINEYRLKSMEEAVRTREASEKAIRIKFKKLKDDFVFNLRLIEERDRELDKYETT